LTDRLLDFISKQAAHPAKSKGKGVFKNDLWNGDKVTHGATNQNIQQAPHKSSRHSRQHSATIRIQDQGHET